MRRLLLCLLLALPTMARADLLFVLNSGDANIQVLDPRTGQEAVPRIPVLREVHHLVLSPDRSLLLVGDSGGNEILFLRPATGEVIRRERISNPYHLDFTPDGRRLVVTSLRRNQVDIHGWDGETLTLQHRLRMPDKPSHLAFTPDGSVVFVTLQGSRALAAIEVATGRHLWTVDVGPEPAGVLWHRGRLLVGIMGRDHIAVVDPETRTIDRTIAIGRGAHAVFLSPDGGTIWATSRVDSRITALDATTLAVRAAWEFPGAGPDCLSFDREGRVWATLRWTGRVVRLDPETGERVIHRAGRSPHGILWVGR
jgi:DNA-binding beta-propeller fold protein YncE